MMKNNFAYPFSLWVLETWKKHSEEIGGPEIARKFRENLSNPKETRKKTFKKTKNIVKK